MKFISAVVLALAGTAIAKGGNKTEKATSIKAQCKQVSKLTQIVDLAANTTKLDQKTNGNTTKADQIKSKAADAQTKLTAMESNTTLMTACQSIFATEDTMQDCGKMAKLEAIMKIAANDTLLTEKTKGNTTKADALKAKATSKAADLTALQSNTTLTTFCSGLKTKLTCAAMSKLQKESSLASNTTALDEKFKGNTTKIAAFQAKASKIQSKLDAMMSNTTLMDACANLKSTSETSEAATSSNTTSGSSGSTSGAVALKTGPIGSMVALVAAFMTALAML